MGDEPQLAGTAITEALETIKSIEMIGFMMEDIEVKLKYAKAVFHCMNILRDMHDQLVIRLPKEVIEQERAKQQPAKLDAKTPAMGVA